MKYPVSSRGAVYVAFLIAAASTAVVSAASCSAVSDRDPNSGTGASGSGGSGGGTTSVCDFCTLDQYTPCVDGEPGDVEVCPDACAPGVGCTACVPGEGICVGNVVHVCSEDGSQTDEVLEECDVNAGELCANGKCGTACEIAADQPSNVGCEFWAVDLDQQDGAGNDPASAPWGVVLSNASDGMANVTIEVNDAAPGLPVQLQVVAQVTVQAGGLESIILPTRELDCGVTPNDYLSPGTCLSSRAFRISSSNPIVIYQFNVFENTYSNDASLLLPTSALGNIYRIINWGAGHPVLIDFPGLPPIIDRSYVTIVGTTANTEVTVRPSWRIKGNPPIAATQAGGEIKVTLGPFDVLNLETDDGTFSDDAKTMADLTGTVVNATQPVAVFSGVETTSVPGPFDIPTYPGWTDGDSCCLDHLEEQMFPVESVGRNYVVTRSPVRSTSGWREPDVLRFLGVAEAAEVTTNLPAPYDKFTLAPGEVVTTSAQDNVVVTATKPVMIGQFLISQGYVEGAVTGDPAFTVFPPVDQYRTEYIILTPGGWNSNHVVMSAPLGAQISIDGVLASCPTEPAGTIEGTTYESHICPLTTGAHSLSGDVPFGIIAYGYGNAGSYAFAGGADVKRIYEPPPVN